MTLVARFRRIRRRAGDAVWSAGDPARRALHSARHTRKVSRSQRGDRLIVLRESWRGARASRRATVAVLAVLPFVLLAATLALILPLAEGKLPPAPAAVRVSGEPASSPSPRDENAGPPKAEAKKPSRASRGPAPAAVEAPVAQASAAPPEPPAVASAPPADLPAASPQRDRSHERRAAPRLLVSEDDRAPRRDPSPRITPSPPAPIPETPEPAPPSPESLPEEPELTPDSDTSEDTAPDENPEPDGGDGGGGD